MQSRGSNLREKMKEVCLSFGDNPYTSYEVYNKMLDLPKKNGGRRHYTLTYSEVKQNLSRADFVDKLDVHPEGRDKTTIYKNKPTNSGDD